MRFLFRLFPCVAAVVMIEIRAGDRNVELQYSTPDVSLEAPAGEAFRERFKVAFLRRADDVFTDRLHPFNLMNWGLELDDRDYDNLRWHAASAARQAFSKSLVYGLRESAVDLPIMWWLRERQEFLADVLRNSVGSVGEEAVAPLDVSYRLVERSWWKRLSENGQLRYGIRPFRTSPYTFLSLALKDGDTLFLLGHVRYHYRNFADHRFEIALSLPLPHGLAIDVGTSYQFGQNSVEERLVVKLAKEFKSGGIVHLGLEAGERPAMLAGIAFPW